MKKERGTFQDKKIISDPNGSYTGKPQNKNEIPVQDADDV